MGYYATIITMDLLPTLEELRKQKAEPDLGYKTLKWSQLRLSKCPLCMKILTRSREALICTSTSNFKRDCFFVISFKKFEKYLREGTLIND